MAKLRDDRLAHLPEIFRVLSIIECDQDPGFVDSGLVAHASMLVEGGHVSEEQVKLLEAGCEKSWSYYRPSYHGPRIPRLRKDRTGFDACFHQEAKREREAKNLALHHHNRRKHKASGHDPDKRRAWRRETSRLA